MLKAIKKKRAFEDIFKQICKLIEKEKIKREDKLPTERELCEIFEVSRATLREAFFSLEAMKLIERRQGSGTFVIATTEEALVQHLTTCLFRKKDDIIDIFFLRKLIEPEVAGLAFEKRTLEELKELDGILKEQERELSKGLSSMRVNSDFHRLLARMAKNRVLESLLLALIDLLQKNEDKYFQTEERKQKSLQGHYEILDAMKNGNGLAAREAMQRHLEDVENTMFRKRTKVAKTVIRTQGLRSTPLPNP